MLAVVTDGRLWLVGELLWKKGVNFSWGIGWQAVGLHGGGAKPRTCKPLPKQPPAENRPLCKMFLRKH